MGREDEHFEEFGASSITRNVQHLVLENASFYFTFFLNLTIVARKSLILPVLSIFLGLYRHL